MLLFLGADRAQHLGATPGFATGDSRIDAVLGALHPEERAVAMAWAQARVRTWAEAALVVGAADPVAAGERVRRKLKRLAAPHRQRTAASAATQAASVMSLLNTAPAVVAQRLPHGRRATPHRDEDGADRCVVQNEAEG
ncbi:hypothetical protein [Streptomyces bobili]|uniref:hypothetical protein n=1 Tax=Streptomyces bobili TaxID=67280 RepID=UPI00371BD554